LQHKNLHKSISQWIVIVILLSRKRNMPIKESDTEKKNYVQDFSALTLMLCLILNLRSHVNQTLLLLDALTNLYLYS